MKNQLILLLVLILICSCTNNNSKHQGTDVLEIDINDINETHNDTTLIKDVEYVFLETNDDCIISEISCILYCNNKFFVEDKIRSNAIFVFNRDGEFLYKVHREGKGPGEYVRISSFDIDKEGNVYIFDSSSKKLIKYYNNGKKFTESKIDYSFFDFSLKDENNLYLVYISGSKISTLFSTYNIPEHKLTPHLEGRELYDDLSIPRFGSKFVFKSNDKLYISPQYTNIVYNIEDGLPVEKIKFDESSIPPKSYLLKMKEDFKYRYKPGSSDKYINAITDIYENNSFLSMEIMIKHDELFLLCKNTGNILRNPGYYNKKCLLPVFVEGVAGDKFLSSIRSFYFSTEEWPERVEKSAVDNETKKKLLSRTAESNPVIVLFDFEEF